MGTNTVNVSDDDFEQVVLQSDVPVMVDFWAAWCGPCRAVAPVMEALAEEYAGQMIVAKVDTDANQEHMSAYGIRGIPTVLFFKGGELVDRIVGAGPKSFYKTHIDEVLKEG